MRVPGGRRTTTRAAPRSGLLAATVERLRAASAGAVASMTAAAARTTSDIRCMGAPTWFHLACPLPKPVPLHGLQRALQLSCRFEVPNELAANGVGTSNRWHFAV